MTANTDALKEAGLTFEEIQSVRRGLEDIENGRFYTEEEFYSRLEKRLFLKNKTCA